MPSSVVAMYTSRAELGNSRSASTEILRSELSVATSNATARASIASIGQPGSVFDAIAGAAGSVRSTDRIAAVDADFATRALDGVVSVAV